MVSKKTRKMNKKTVNIKKRKKLRNLNSKVPMLEKPAFTEDAFFKPVSVVFHKQLWSYERNYSDLKKTQNHLQNEQL